MRSLAPGTIFSHGICGMIRTGFTELAGDWVYGVNISEGGRWTSSSLAICRGFRLLNVER